MSCQTEHITNAYEPLCITAYGTAWAFICHLQASPQRDHFIGMGGGGTPAVALFLDRVTTPNPRPMSVTHPATSHQKSLPSLLATLRPSDPPSAPPLKAPPPPLCRQACQVTIRCLSNNDVTIFLTRKADLSCQNAYQTLFLHMSGKNIKHAIALDCSVAHM